MCVWQRRRRRAGKPNGGIVCNSAALRARPSPRGHVVCMMSATMSDQSRMHCVLGAIADQHSTCLDPERGPRMSVNSHAVCTDRRPCTTRDPVQHLLQALNGRGVLCVWDLSQPASPTGSAPKRRPALRLLLGRFGREPGGRRWAASVSADCMMPAAKVAALPAGIHALSSQPGRSGSP